MEQTKWNLRLQLALAFIKRYWLMIVLVLAFAAGFLLRGKKQDAEGDIAKDKERIDKEMKDAEAVIREKLEANQKEVAQKREELKKVIEVEDEKLRLQKLADFANKQRKRKGR